MAKVSNLCDIRIQLGSLLAATWDSPPRPDEPGYGSFAEAFERYVRARDVRVPKYTNAELRQIASRPKDEYRHRHLLKNAADLKLGQNPDLLLLPFQVGWIEFLFCIRLLKVLTG
jgi:chromodomain-helicase-DNA-binding protein 4